MNAEDRAKLRKQLVLHEGRRAYPYKCTAGKWTIGVGFNFEDRGLDALSKAIGREVNFNDLVSRGLTDAEIDRALDHDINYFEERVRHYFPQYDQLDPVRQRVIVDFAFNLGKRALGFTAALAALKNAVDCKSLERQRLYYCECGAHMMNSLWATQVGDGAGKRYDRAERLVNMMRSGQDYSR
jgi:lysozyme